jgi:hypothetical protein
VSSQPVNDGAGGGQVTSRQWILLGVLGAVLVGVLGVLVIRPMLAKSGQGPVTGSVPVEASPTPSPTTTTRPGGGQAAGGSTSRVLAPTIAGRAAKDPFTPLVSQSTTEDTTTGTTSSGSSGSTGSTGSTGSSGSSGSSSTSSDAGASAQDKLTLVSVTGSGDDAEITISVDGTRYAGGVGDTLAGTYVVVSATSECADFRADGDTFTACETSTADK